MLISLPAEAHDWYPKECCEENHCHPVNCAEIRNGGTSSYFWRGYLFPKTLVSPSLDGNCHVCKIPRAYGRDEPKVYVPGRPVVIGFPLVGNQSYPQFALRDSGEGLGAAQEGQGPRRLMDCFYQSIITGCQITEPIRINLTAAANRRDKTTEDAR